MLWRSLHELISSGRFLLKWIALTAPLGLAVGSCCALFLWSLDGATATRFQFPWLFFLLPVAGALVGGMYHLFGKSAEAGNNLILDEIHAPGGGVPLRMAPLILVGTLITHLFGGSAGREGTAVQVGGSLAGGLARLLRILSPADRRILLMTGVSAGFGGVFGTPFAGTIFALEVLTIGRVSYQALLPCFLASIAADATCTAWGIHHSHYSVHSQLPAGWHSALAPFQIPLFLKAAVVGALSGMASLFFVEMAHGVNHGVRRFVRWPWARPVCGGLALIVLVSLLGTREYLGLGVSSPHPGDVTIARCFEPGGAHAMSWFWKIVFTAVTVGSGFKGGEVTPLFFIGAALGNSLAGWLGAPVDLLAALGFVAVFAGATNTPVACTIMAVELFGGEFTVYFATACLVAYLFSGHSGIYLSQRLGLPKGSSELRVEELSLRAIRGRESSRSEGLPSENFDGDRASEPEANARGSREEKA